MAVEDGDPLHGHAQGVSADLRHDGLVALPQGGDAQVDGDALGAGDGHAGALGRAEAGVLHEPADADAMVASVPLLPLQRLQLVPAETFQRVLQRPRVVAAVEHGGGDAGPRGPQLVGDLLGLDEVLAAQVDGVHAQVPGHHVEHALAEVAGLVAARGPVGAHPHLVGHDAADVGLVGRDPVGAGQHAGGGGRHQPAVGADVGAHVAVDVGAHAQQRAVLARGDLQLAAHLPRVVGGHQVLAPILDPLDRPPELHGGVGDQVVLRVELAADAEAAAHVGLDEVDTVLRHLQQRRQHRAVEVRHLGHAPYRQLVPARVPGRHQAAGLHGVAGVAVRPQHLLAGILRVAEGPLHVPQHDVVAAGHVGALLFVDDHFAAQCRLHVRHHRQRLILHPDQVGPVLGHVTVHGGHQRHRLAHVADLAPGQRVLQEAVQPVQLVHAQRDRLDARRQIGKGEHADDPRELQGLRHVHRLDARVRVRAPQDGRVQHPGQLHVVDERGLAGQEPNVLAAPDRRPDVSLRHVPLQELPSEMSVPIFVPD